MNSEAERWRQDGVKRRRGVPGAAYPVRMARVGWSAVVGMACLWAGPVLAQESGKVGLKPVSLGALQARDFPSDLMEVIQTLPGFRVEIVAKADQARQGSWISLARDGEGRLWLGANELQPFTRLTLGPDGKVVKNETIHTPVSEAMGMVWHDNSLYVQGGRGTTNVAGNDRPGYGRLSGVAGLHRLRDPKGDGAFSSVETLRTWTGPEGGHSDHGVHAPHVSADGRYLYLINGNGVVQPPDVSPNSPMRHWGDDRIIPLLGPLTGGIGQERPPAGFVGRTDLEGRDFHLVAAGLRNALHIGFNADGEMFTFDSDMELELGVPWYRPNRVCHLPSGADLGYRGNSGKYPSWYEDSLPALVDIGLASPVGVAFGYGARFPGRYQKALLIADNSHGRIMAVHLKPSGSGYAVSSWENLVVPKTLGPGPMRTPLNVTDLVVGLDGALYFATGNRRVQSYLFRVTYVGDESTERVEYREVDGAAERALRRSLEAHHWTTDQPEAVKAAWPHLGSADRNLRYAARVALETVSPSRWKAAALAETDPAKAMVALLALARVGGKESNEELFGALGRFPLAGLPLAVQLQKLRAIEVAVSRNGKPSEAAVARVVADIESCFPATAFELNTEMSQILAAFEAPSVVERTMRLAERTAIYEEQFAYRYNLRSVRTGWTPELRRQYFRWFNRDHSEAPHRATYRLWFTRVGQAPRTTGNDQPMAQIRRAAMETLTDAEKADPVLASILTAPREVRPAASSVAPVPTGP